MVNKDLSAVEAIASLEVYIVKGHVAQDHVHLLVSVPPNLSISEKTTREDKDRYGNLAYISDTLKGIKNPPFAHYRLNIDGQLIEEDAITCLILNAGSTGGINLHANQGP